MPFITNKMLCDFFINGKPRVPKIKNIHSKVYEAAKRPRALKMDDFHTCETTHCRAGWVVHLAGEAGYALEEIFDTEIAAILIYKVSGYEIDAIKFFDSKKEALADMKQLAEQEGKS